MGTPLARRRGFWRRRGCCDHLFTDGRDRQQIVDVRSQAPNAGSVRVACGTAPGRLTATTPPNGASPRPDESCDHIQAFGMLGSRSAFRRTSSRSVEPLPRCRSALDEQVSKVHGTGQERLTPAPSILLRPKLTHGQQVPSWPDPLTPGRPTKFLPTRVRPTHGWRHRQGGFRTYASDGHSGRSRPRLLASTMRHVVLDRRAQRLHPLGALLL